MTRVFILFKKTDFNTILACFGGKVYWVVGTVVVVHNIFVAKIGTICNFIDTSFL